MYANKNFLYSSILILLFLSGCSNTNKPQFKSFFKTEIHENHSKVFNFSLVLVSGEYTNETNSKAQKQGKGKGNGKGKGQGKGKHKKSNDVANEKKSQKKSNVNKIEKQLDTRLAIELGKNNYCRNGYMELERNLGQRYLSIRGECRENASINDRERFPNNH